MPPVEKPAPIVDEEGAVNGDVEYFEGNGYFDEYGEWVPAAPGEVYDEWGNLTYKDGEEQGYYDDETGDWVQYYYDEDQEEEEEEVAMAVDEEAASESAPTTAVEQVPPTAQQPQDQAQTQGRAVASAAADEAAKAADEAAKAAADAASAAAEASKNLMKGFSNFGGGLMGSLSATTTPKQKQDKAQQKSTNFGIGGLGGFGFGGGKKQEAKSPGFSFGGLGFGNTSSSIKSEPVTLTQALGVQPETESLVPAEEEQNGHYDETTGDWVPAAPGEVYDEWGNLTYKDGIEQGYYDEESGEWITYDEAEEYDEYGNVKEKEKTPDDVEMASLHEAEPVGQDPGPAFAPPEQSPETVTQAPEMSEESPATTNQEQTKDRQVKTESGGEEDNGYYDETTGEWICAAPGEVYDEWGNLTHKDGIEQGYYDEPSGEWIRVDPAEVYDEFGNLTHKDGVEQGYYDEATGEFIPYEVEEGEGYDEYGNVIPGRGKDKSPEDAEMVAVSEDSAAATLKQDQVVPEAQPVTDDNKTAGFTARQRWLWAFGMVTKVMRTRLLPERHFGAESRVETRKKYRSLLKTADDAMELPSLFLTLKASQCGTGLLFFFHFTLLFFLVPSLLLRSFALTLL